MPAEREREREREPGKYETLSLCCHYTKSAVMSFSCVSLYSSLNSCVCVSTCESTCLHIRVCVCVVLGSDGLPKENGCHYSLRMKQEKRKTKQEPERGEKADMMSACVCV